MEPSAAVLVSPVPSSTAGLEAGSSDGALSFTDEAVSILTSNSLLARSLLGRSSALKRKESPSGSSNGGNRRKREFIPDEKKDEGYWDKRKKNNEAAKRSREKRRVNDMVLESRVMALLEENARLRAELLALKFRFGLVKDPSDVHVLPLATPTCAQAPSATRYFVPRSEGAQPSPPAPPQPAPPHGCLYSGRGVRDNSSLSEDSGFSTPGGSSVGSPVFFDDRMSEHGKMSPHGGEEPGFEPHHCPMGMAGEGLPSGGPAGLYPGDMSRDMVTRVDSGETMKSLPHKLRFKVAGGGDGGDVGGAPPEPRRSPVQLAVMREPMRSPTFFAGPEGPAVWQQHLREEGRGGRPSQEQQYGPQPTGYGVVTHRGQTDSQYHMENRALRCQLSSLSEEVAQLKRLFSQQLLSKAK
ncbi:uncharacterized protein [Paramormyrops kingsleyae]|uniref:BZIP domain-containing protein n=1 Tax=Paramormyrops kingsleyae TaxID=1676925 RepID=A0A3B3S699_9TELE|nr:uncharacterized protein LOC111833457 [Paramormyrops kingsleyae]